MTRLPATVPEIIAAVERLLAERGPLSTGDLLAALVADGVEVGSEPEATLHDVLEDEDAGPRGRRPRGDAPSAKNPTRRDDLSRLLDTFDRSPAGPGSMNPAHLRTVLGL